MHMLELKCDSGTSYFIFWPAADCFGRRVFEIKWVVSHNSAAKKSRHNPATQSLRSTCISPWRDEGKIARNDFFFISSSPFSRCAPEPSCHRMCGEAVFNEETTTRERRASVTILLRSFKKCENETKRFWKRKKDSSRKLVIIEEILPNLIFKKIWEWINF